MKTDISFFIPKLRDSLKSRWKPAEVDSISLWKTGSVWVVPKVLWLPQTGYLSLAFALLKGHEIETSHGDRPLRLTCSTGTLPVSGLLYRTNLSLLEHKNDLKYIPECHTLQKSPVNFSPWVYTGWYDPTMKIDHLQERRYFKI